MEGRPRLAFAWVAFGLLAAAIGAVGLSYHAYLRAHLRNLNFHELAAVAEIKANVIDVWRRERLADAGVLAANPIVGRSVEEWFLGSPVAGLRDELSGWLEVLRRQYGYESIAILDSKGSLRIAVPPGATVEPGPFVGRPTPSRTGGEVHFSAVYRAGRNSARLDVVAPLHGTRSVEAPPLGWLVLRVDPAAFLYPFIKRWPTPSATAEVLLLERDGDEVVYLSELRHAGGVSPGLRLPLTRPELPGAHAVQGLTGGTEGKDYRGKPVLAAYRPIPGSQWGIVAKVDREEAYAPMRQSTILLGLSVGALILGAALSVLFLSSRYALRRSEEQQRTLEERDRARAELLEAEKRARAAIEVSRERMRLATEAAALGTWDWDLAAGRLEWDARSKEILGLPPDAEVSFELFTRMIHPEDRERVEEAVGRALAKRDDYHTEYRAVRADGQTRWISARGRVFTNEEATPVRMAGVAMDVTRRKAFEAALARAEALELAARAKAEFMALASHELHTPLNGILGYADLLLDGVDGPLTTEQRKSVQKIAGSGRKLAALADAILDLSRLQVEEEPSTVDFALRETITKGVEPYRRKAAVKGLTFTAEVEDDVPDHLCGEPGRLLQALGTLLDNAVKFTVQGSVHLRVSRERGREAETLLRFAVRDTGFGIPWEERESIFRPFHQVQCPDTRSCEGLGLGLALCSILVHKLGGKVGVESEPGQGSVFFFTAAMKPAVAASAHEVLAEG